jgi:ABC-2 type transport system ATP-binding protein
VHHFAGYYADPRDPDEVIAAVGLTEKRKARNEKLSGGQRRRLLLARALMHRPRLVILDEPTAGVDFELRLELWRYIRQLHSEGTTILLTTHYLEEAEELCEEIALIGGGRIMARDTADGLKDRYEADSLEQVYLKTVATHRLDPEAEEVSAR